MLRLLSSIQGIPHTIIVQESVLTVGRAAPASSGAQVCLQHKACPALLSRRHAALRLRSDGCMMIKDLGSMNGTFVSDGPGQAASRIPSQEDWPVRPGCIVYFGAKDNVISNDGSQCPNPFIYCYEGCSTTALQEAAEQQQAAEPNQVTAFTLAAHHPEQNPIRPANPPQQQQQQQQDTCQLQQQWQRRQKHKGAPHPSPAQAAKRQKLLHAAEIRRTDKVGQAQAPATLQQPGPAAAQIVPPFTPASEALHNPSSLAEVAAAAADSGRNHDHCQLQLQGRVVAGSEPEILQQLQQQRLPNCLEPQQQLDQQHITHAEQPGAAAPQAKAQQAKPPASEVDVSISQQQQHTPATRRRATAQPNSKAPAPDGFSRLSPGMRVSVSALECAICKFMMVAPHSLGCGHAFCGPCLEQWLERPEPTCPTCRCPVKHAPILQRILDSIVSEAALNQGSESQDRAARLELWHGVKDVTTLHWRERFNASSCKPNKLAKRANMQQTTAAVAAADRARILQQQHPLLPAPPGVISLLAGRHDAIATAVAAATVAAAGALARQPNTHRGGRRSPHTGAAARAGRASGTAVAAAAAMTATAAAVGSSATSRPKSARRARGRKTSRASNRNPRERPRVAVQGQPQQGNQQQQQQTMTTTTTRPRVVRQQAIHDFVGHAHAAASGRH